MRLNAHLVTEKDAGTIDSGDGVCLCLLAPKDEAGPAPEDPRVFTCGTNVTVSCRGVK